MQKGKSKLLPNLNDYFKTPANYNCEKLEILITTKKKHFCILTFLFCAGKQKKTQRGREL